ncbi:hypothetical protein RHSIM_Rhsim05G0091300 [Rhododendron simsii]|uniref:Ribonuclease H n=1 Tax=Rhododendron simsii TaxID=118357 RepID=A0A834H6P0_RHOSS|nr:hypothetical protein RHSIM_Rhsim05G0091300 [Rhododendron simsii]
MSSSAHPWHNEDEAVTSDDDDLLDLEFLALMEDEKRKMPQRTRMRGKKFYVVFVGRNPGIYDSWAACSDQVNGFSGAVHNKFASWDEAYNAWLAYTCQVEQMVPPPILPSLEDAAGPSSEYAPPGRDSFPVWLILSMTFCVIVVVATIMFYLF